MSREPDAKCARALGLEPQFVDTEMSVFTVNRQFLEVGDYWYRGEGGIYKVPCYSTDYSAANLLEDEIDRLGLQERYIGWFYRHICTDNMNSREEVWAILRAKPEQRAQAFLWTVRQ